LALFLALISISCEDFIEVDLPDSQLSGDLIFNDIGTATAAVTDIYSKLSSNVLICGNYRGISILLGSYTDEVETVNMELPDFNFFLNNIIASNDEISHIWNKSYNLIYAVNAIKEGLENSTTIDSNEKEPLLGELYFLRAFIHFQLTNLFGDIPYVTSTDYKVNTTIEKLPITQVYDLVISDLETAKFFIPAQNHPMQTRPGADAIRTLLARTYLYSKNWHLAAMEADEVINSGRLSWVNSIEEVFLKSSPGTIWQLMPQEEGLPTMEAQNFIFTLVPPPARAINDQLIEAFEPGDMRKELWIGSISGNDKTWYYPFKYKQSEIEAVSQEYSVIMRLEELYLIRAEARLNLGDSYGAKNDINKIRSRAGLPETSANSEFEIKNAILQERRIEFFSEQGHRFFDLKRTGDIDAVLIPIKPGWKSHNILWPLPESELLLNPNLLPQNNGY
jgi:hypothetical protein